MKALYTKPIANNLIEPIISLGMVADETTTYAEVFDFLYNKGVYVSIVAIQIAPNMYSFQPRMVGCPQWTGCGTTWEMCAKFAISYVIDYLKK